MATIRPEHDFILVELDEKPDRTEGGIFLPSTVDVDGGLKVGTVKDIGPGRRNEAGDRITIEYAQGDKILFEEHLAKEFRYGREDIVLVRHENVIGRVED